MLTDDLWLAAHDSVNGRPRIGDWPLGVGLATGLLGELVHGELCVLEQGELFRTAAEAPDDPALVPLLIKMESEERSWPTPQPQPQLGRARTPAAAHDHQGWQPAARHGQDWPPAVQDHRGWAAAPRHAREWPPTAQNHRSWSPAAHGGGDWQPEAYDGQRRQPPIQQENRHRTRGHKLGEWISYLAYENRAEERVIARLSRTGLVRRDERRRLFGGKTVRYVPYDSVAAGIPATRIVDALQRRRDLSWSELFLAGLFLATGLHHHALFTLDPAERSRLAQQLGRGLDEMSRDLLRAADAAVGEAAMR
jgi:hypothetical protein